MELTLLGTGSPIPTLERGGTALAVTISDETVLIDCGPRAVYGLIENEIHPADIHTLFFTHHHIDHNAAFFHFALAGWTLGRRSLTVYGPPGTESLLDALLDIYEQDIAYRRELGYPAEGIVNIEFEETSPALSAETEHCSVTAMPVDHSITTYAYRLDADDGRSLVFSGDTGELPALAEFAAGADVLVHDAGIGPVGADTPDLGLVWESYTEPMAAEKRERLEAVHCDPTQSGEIAAAAGVDMLVLTHLLPYRDTTAMRSEAEAVFDGEIVIAEDGLSLEF